MNKVSFQHPYKIVELAAGKVQSNSPSGKRKAVGDITFTGNAVEGDTFTINGVVFTAVADSAEGNQFNVAASQTLSIDALAAVLNASVDPLVSGATYSNSGGTKLHVVADAYGAEANAFTLAEVATNATTVATLTGGVTPDPLSLDAETKALTTIAGTVNEWDLPAGEEGQETTFYLAVKGAGASAQINGAFAGGTKITLDTVGKYFKAKFLGASWVPLSNTGTLA